MLVVELYSTPSCSKCMLTQSMLEGKIEYLSIKDVDKVLEKAKGLGITEMPILDVNGQSYSGMDAVLKAKDLVEGIDA